MITIKPEDIMHEIDRTGAGGALSPEVRSLVATIVNGVLALAGASRYSNEGSNPFGVAIKTKGCRFGSLCLALCLFIIYEAIMSTYTQGWDDQSGIRHPKETADCHVQEYRLHPLSCEPDASGSTS